VWYVFILLIYFHWGLDTLKFRALSIIVTVAQPGFLNGEGVGGGLRTEPPAARGHRGSGGEPVSRWSGGGDPSAERFYNFSIKITHFYS